MKSDIKKIIDDVLNMLSMYSPESADLVYRTGMVESGYRRLTQIKGPALGFFQIEPATLKDCWDNYIVYRKDLMAKVYELGFRENDMDFCLLTNIALQVAFCRIKYRRDPEPIPTKIESQAVYWKRIYNGPGKGTVEKFMEANRES